MDVVDWLTCKLIGDNVNQFIVHNAQLTRICFADPIEVYDERSTFGGWYILL